MNRAVTYYADYAAEVAEVAALEAEIISIEREHASLKAAEAEHYRRFKGNQPRQSDSKPAKKKEEQHPAKCCASRKMQIQEAPSPQLYKSGQQQEEPNPEAPLMTSSSVHEQPMRMGALRVAGHQLREEQRRDERDEWERHDEQNAGGGLRSVHREPHSPIKPEVAAVPRPRTPPVPKEDTRWMHSTADTQSPALPKKYRLPTMHGPLPRRRMGYAKDQSPAASDLRSCAKFKTNTKTATVGHRRRASDETSNLHHALQPKPPTLVGHRRRASDEPLLTNFGPMASGQGWHSKALANSVACQQAVDTKYNMRGRRAPRTTIVDAGELWAIV